MSLSRRLQGLRGMSWGAAGVIHIGQTASRLSRLGQPLSVCTDDGAQRSGRSALNSKIMYQYLRGDRCPVEGPRGKYNVDLTGAVHALPGGATARLWLQSPLWEVLDSAITPDRLASIQLTMNLASLSKFLRQYIELWIRYRLLTLAGSKDMDLQDLAHAMDACHDKLCKTDAVFNHIYQPLLRYLELAEPRLPLARSHSSPSRPEAATSLEARIRAGMWAGIRRVDQRNRRFSNGVERYIRSGRVRMPDHRFLATFRDRWHRFLVMDKEAASLDWCWRVRLGLPARGSPWEALCEAFGIRHPETDPEGRTTRRQTPATHLRRRHSKLACV